MRGKIVLLLLVFQSFWAAQIVPATLTTDDVSAKLDKRVLNYNLGLSNFVEALVQVGTDFQIPIGITWVNTPGARAERAFAWKDATVQEIIEAVAKTQPGFQVLVKNGVVHVFSPELPPERENFLTMKIKAFRVRDEYAEMASFKLHNLVTPRNHAGFSIGANIEPKISLELTNSTAEDVLDALIVASALKIWVVTFSSDPTLTTAGFRRSMSLWGDTPSPEPVWDLLHWGDKIPRVAGP